MSSQEHVDEPSDPRFWSTEVIGPVTVLRFHQDSIGAGIDLRRISTLWEFLEGFQEGPDKVLLISIPSGNLSPNALDRLWEYLCSIPSDEYLPEVRNYRARTELVREEYAMKRFIGYVRDGGIFVVAACQGEIDISFLGLLLACDYRIAAEDTVIVNRVHPFGMKPGTAAPWFLVRLLGQSRALEILLHDERLAARDARELGIVHRLTKSDSHERDSLEIAKSLASKGIEELLALKRAIAASEGTLDAYLQDEGAGFTRLPSQEPSCDNHG